MFFWPCAAGPPIFGARPADTGLGSPNLWKRTGQGSATRLQVLAVPDTMGISGRLPEDALQGLWSKECSATKRAPCLAQPAAPRTCMTASLGHLTSALRSLRPRNGHGNRLKLVYAAPFLLHVRVDHILCWLIEPAELYQTFDSSSTVQGIPSRSVKVRTPGCSARGRKFRAIDTAPRKSQLGTLLRKTASQPPVCDRHHSASII